MPVMQQPRSLQMPGAPQNRDCAKFAAPMNIINTARLALRELTPADAAFMLGLLNEPAFVRFVGDRGVRTLAQARDYLLQGPINSYRTHGFGLYLVELKHAPTPLGICGLIQRDFLPDVDIGYALLPEFTAHGYALEAAAAVMAYAKTSAGLKRVVAIVAPDNQRSLSLLGKLGFAFERMITLPADGSERALYSVSI